MTESAPEYGFVVMGTEHPDGSITWDIEDPGWLPENGIRVGGEWVGEVDDSVDKRLSDRLKTLLRVNATMWPNLEEN